MLTSFAERSMRSRPPISRSTDAPCLPATMTSSGRSSVSASGELFLGGSSGRYLSMLAWAPCERFEMPRAEFVFRRRNSCRRILNPQPLRARLHERRGLGRVRPGRREGLWLRVWSPRRAIAWERQVGSASASREIRKAKGAGAELQALSANSPSGLGWLGSYRPISPAPGILNCAIRPQPSSSIGDTNSTPLPLSSSTVCSILWHMKNRT